MLGVGAVPRLERDAWSMVKLTEASNTQVIPSPRTRAPSPDTTSVAGLATPERGDKHAALACITLSTGRIKRKSRRAREARLDADDASDDTVDEHSFVVAEMAPGVNNRSPRVEVKPDSPRESLAENGQPPFPPLAGFRQSVPSASSPGEGVKGPSAADCGQSVDFFSHECRTRQSLPVASLGRSPPLVASTAAMAAVAAAAVGLAPPAAVGTSPQPAVGVSPPAATSAAAAAAVFPAAVGLSPPAVGVSIPAVGVSPPAVGVHHLAVGINPPAYEVSIPASGVSRPAVGISPPDAGAMREVLLQGIGPASEQLLAPPPAARPAPSRRNPVRVKRKNGSKGQDGSEGRGGSREVTRPRPVGSGHVARRIRTCSFGGGCRRRPSFGCLGDAKASRCASHKTDGQVDITSRRCEREGCTRFPTFRPEDGEGGKSCAEHRRPGMEKIRVCEGAEGCTRSPSFGFRGSKRNSCSLHKVEGMVNLNITRCRAPADCGRTPHFAFRGLPASFCAKHKEARMVNVVSRRCENDSCDRIPSYGWEGSGPKASFCSTHKAEGMVNVRHPRCKNSECRRQPTFGKEGGKAVFCKEHKDEDMVGVVNYYYKKRKNPRKA